MNPNVRVSADDLQKINRTSVPLADGPGYFAMPGECETHTLACQLYTVAIYESEADDIDFTDVYHQLHCLVSELA